MPAGPAPAAAAPSEAEPEAEAPSAERGKRLQTLRDAARLLRQLMELWLEHHALPGESADRVLAADVFAVAGMLDMDPQDRWHSDGDA